MLFIECCSELKVLDMLELKTKENINIYLEIDGDRQWVRKLDTAIRLGKVALHNGLKVKLIETVRLWGWRTGKPKEQLDYNEYDRTELLRAG